MSLFRNVCRTLTAKDFRCGIDYSGMDYFQEMKGAASVSFPDAERPENQSVSFDGASVELETAPISTFAIPISQFNPILDVYVEAEEAKVEGTLATFRLDVLSQELQPGFVAPATKPTAEVTVEEDMSDRGRGGVVVFDPTTEEEKFRLTKKFRVGDFLVYGSPAAGVAPDDTDLYVINHLDLDGGKVKVRVKGWDGNRTQKAAAHDAEKFQIFKTGLRWDIAVQVKMVGSLDIASQGGGTLGSGISLTPNVQPGNPKPLFVTLATTDW